MTSILSVDVEDWFHLLDLPTAPRMPEWDSLPSRVEMNFRKMLDLFGRNDVRCTCFFLGWVAEKYPHLAREASALGHEVASHGYSHTLVYHMSPSEFLRDIRRAKETLEDVTGRPVTGYRAPGFSVTERTPWFFEKLVEAGYRYDASVFPAHRCHGGMPDAPGLPCVVRSSSGSIIEFPMSVVEILSTRLCLFGGGYLRLFPWRLTKFMASRVIRQGRPVIFYVHPREIDPDQPRLPMSFVRSFRSYVNLKTTHAKLERIVTDFRLTTFQQFIKEHWNQFAGSPMAQGTRYPRIQSAAGAD